MPSLFHRCLEPQRVLIFLLLLTLLWLPARQVRHTLLNSEQRMREQLQQEAQRRNEQVLSLLAQNQRNQRILVEEQLERLSTSIAQMAENLRRETKEPLAHAVNAVLPISSASAFLPKNSGLDIRSRMIGMLVQEFRPVDRTPMTEQMHTVRTSGLSPDQQAWFEELFAHAAYDYLKQDYASASRRFNEQIAQFFPTTGSSRLYRGYIDASLRGKLTPVQLGNQPGWLFTQILLRTANLGPCDLQLKTYPSYVNPYDFQEATRRELLLGHVAFFLPRSERPLLSPFDLVQLFERGGTSLALIPERDDPILADVFKSGDLEQILAAPDTSIPITVGDHVVDFGHTWLERPFHVVAATRIQEPASWFKIKSHILHTLLAVGFLYAGLLLFRSVFFGTAIATRLWYKLAAGFLMASLMPLALAFDVIEQHFQLRAAQLESSYRQQLRNHLEALDHRALLTRQTARQSLELLSRSPDIYQDLPAVPSASQTYVTQSALQRLYDKLCEETYTSKIHRVSPNRLTLSTINDRWTEPQEQRNQEKDSLSLFLAAAGDLLFEDLGQSRSSERTVSGDARQEIILSEFVQLIVNTLDPVSAFFMLKGANDLLIINSGQGHRYIHRLFLPSEASPTHMLHAFTGRVQESGAVRRLVGAPHQFPGRVFLTRVPQQGFNIWPADGMQYPFLRHVFRTLAFHPVDLSQTVEHNGRTYLVEGHSCRLVQSFIFAGFIDRDELLHREHRLHLFSQLTILLAVCLLLFLATKTSQEFLEPVQTLSNAIDSLHTGNYSVRLAVTRSDELGRLFRSFNELVRCLHEGHMLGSMVSQRARHAMRSSHEEADALTGKRAFATIVYVALSHAESDRHDTDADTFTGELSRQITVICRTAARHAGETDKIMGGKILLVFGLSDHDDGSGLENAVRFATDVYAETALPVPPAIGINYGPIISGLLGSGSRRDFTVIGDTVNLAARLCSCAASLSDSQIVLPESTLRWFRVRPPVRSLGGTHIKGKSQEVEAVQLVASRHPDPSDA